MDVDCGSSSNFTWWMIHIVWHEVWCNISGSSAISNCRWYLLLYLHTIKLHYCVLNWNFISHWHSNHEFIFAGWCFTSKLQQYCNKCRLVLKLTFISKKYWEIDLLTNHNNFESKTSVIIIIVIENIIYKRVKYLNI